MTTFFCPRCWVTLAEERPKCPACGCDVAAYLAGKTYTQRLIEALSHPEPETPVRVAYILGLRGDREAVPALVATASRTPDVYLAMACLDALARIGGREAEDGIRSFLGDRRILVAGRAQELLGNQPALAIDAAGGGG
jgi:HEAT repeat protein